MKDEKTADSDTAKAGSVKASAIVPSSPRLTVESVVRKSPVIHTVTGSVSKGFETDGKMFKTRAAATNHALSLLGGKPKR